MTYRFISAKRLCFRAALCALFAFPLSAQGYPQERTSPKQPDRELEHAFGEIKKDPKSWAQSLLDAQEALGRFGYGALFTAKLDERTQEALKSYQHHNNLPATGELDFGTWLQLQHDENALTPDIPIGPLYIFNDSDWDNVLTTQGIWLEHDKDPSPETPVRPSRIECFKSNNLCIAATRGDTLINLQYLTVARWDKFEIQTQPDELPCGREYVQINRAQKTVLTVNTAAYKDEEACTKLFGPPGKAAISQLSDPAPLRKAKLQAYRSAHERVMVISTDAKERAGITNH